MGGAAAVCRRRRLATTRSPARLPTCRFECRTKRRPSNSPTGAENGAFSSCPWSFPRCHRMRPDSDLVFTAGRTDADLDMALNEMASVGRELLGEGAHFGNDVAVPLKCQASPLGNSTTIWVQRSADPRRARSPSTTERTYEVCGGRCPEYRAETGGRAAPAKSALSRDSGNLESLYPILTRRVNMARTSCRAGEPAFVSCGPKGVLGKKP